MLNIAKSGLQILTVNGSDYKSEPAGKHSKKLITNPNQRILMVLINFGKNHIAIKTHSHSKMNTSV